MAYTLPQLAKDLIARVKTLPSNDHLTLGWFSSEGGEFNFMLKGFKVTEQADYKILEDTINKNKTPIGCTCFSEILTDKDKVIKDLSAISTKFAVCFFTDGYPVVNNYQREIDHIYSAIAKIQGRVSSSLLVGYGNYYNKTLMADMAQRFGGALIHSENLSAFDSALAKFLADSRNNEGKVDVDMPAGQKVAVFSLNGEQITNYKEEGGKVAFVPTTATEDFVYFLSERPESGSEDVALTDSVVKSDEAIVAAAYAAAYILTQSTKTDKALEVLSAVGDKALIDAVNNAFTNAEYGAAEQKIKDAMLDLSKRFQQGRNTKYLPAADAFCLLDVLDILGQDDQARFYPYNEKFKYERIGSATEQRQGFGKFTADRTSSSSISDLVWHGTMLNMSIRTKVNGTVNLQGEYKKQGFAEDYPCSIYRAYTVVKDGFLNIKEFPITMSQATFTTLKDKGLIDDPSWKSGEVYVLHLDRVPVINRAIADGKTSAKDLCKLCYQEISLEAQIKAFNYFKAQLEEKPEARADSALTAAQEAFLEANGIKRGIFSPPVDKIKANDHYFAKEFDIKIKDHSSLPKVEEVITAAKDPKKKVTATKALVKVGVDRYEKMAGGADPKKQLSIVKDMIGQAKGELGKVRGEIQRTKFAVILGKRWFDEFTSREDNKLSLDGKDFTVSVREVKVEV